jgi:riboflavin kinase/FMN adenylyltransferase
MQQHRGLSALPPGLRFVVTVGVFDGLHRGHLAVLEALVRLGRRVGAAPVVITFDPHPEAVLRGTAPPLLCDPAEGDARFAAIGIAHVVVQHFDATFASLGAAEFVERMRSGRDLAGLVMTPESAFGRGREGTVALVSGLGASLGFAVEVVAPVLAGGAPISSSRIRALLVEGRLARAAVLLGRRPSVTGIVVAGDGRGRELGFPTANLAFEHPVALPPDGIYAACVGWGGGDPLRPGRTADAVVSLGVRPTFGGGERVFEVHLLDVAEALYGQHLRVEFVRRQRGQRRFRGAADLIAQMRRDVVRARALLADVREPA